MIYGYSRVSTVGQKKNGNSLADQRVKLIAAGAEEIISDSYTGTKMSRPGWNALIEKIKPGDTLIVCKIDRFARTASEGVAAIMDLINRGVTVDILNMGRADSSPMGKLMINILLAFAEFERDSIVERTQSGKAIAREKGVRVDGRPNKYNEQQRQLAIQLLQDGNSYNEVAKKTGISRSTLIRLMREVKAQDAQRE